MVAPHPGDPILDTLRRQYLQLVTPTDISLAHIPPSLLLDQDFQHSIYTSIINPSCNSPHGQPPPPPPRRYTARVVKMLITRIEEEAWKEGLIASIPTTSASTDSTSTAHVTYTITLPSLPYSPTTTTTTATTTTRASDSLTLIESRNIISSSGHTGSRTWEAALALGELLISSHYHYLTSPRNADTSPATKTAIFTTPLPHKHILELGAGTGFLSILCAKLGARKVLATDGDWRVCTSLQKNISENGVEGVVEVARLLWGRGGGGVVEKTEDEDEHKELDGKQENKTPYIIPDVVLAADVTYDTSIIPDLVTELKYILTQQNPHAHILVAATVRNLATFEVFLKELEGHSLAWESQLWTPHVPRILFYPTTTPIRILKITCPMVETAAV